MMSNTFRGARAIVSCVHADERTHRACRSAASAAEQQPLRFRMGTVQAEGTYTEGQRKFVKLVGERTGGKVQIEHFCCNQLGGERQLADGVKLGTIGMAPVGATGSQIYDLLFTAVPVP
jgi:TRAP-type C4-dicarboxylate transport system substrate-binding protein